MQIVEDADAADTITKTAHQLSHEIIDHYKTHADYIDLNVVDFTVNVLCKMLAATINATRKTTGEDITHKIIPAIEHYKTGKIQS